MSKVAGLLMLLLAACCGTARAGAVLDGIRARGELRVGTTGDYKPFSFRLPDGRYEGADIVMAERLAAALGVRVLFVATQWGRLAQDFTDGRFDVAVGGVTILPDRAAVGAFTEPTYVDGKRPVARCEDRGRYVSIAAIDQPEVRVIVNPGASNEAFARAQFPHAHLAVHADNPGVPDEIVAGRADVFVTDGIEVEHIVHSRAGLCATNMPAPFTRLEKAFWMQRDADLQALVADWLAGEKASGFWARTLAAALAAR